jgi:hypothetical protein
MLTKQTGFVRSFLNSLPPLEKRKAVHVGYAASGGEFDPEEIQVVQ